jgi:PHD/YefM family antitoxin component YafN of YafNO toxin-antitoxin module
MIDLATDIHSLTDFKRRTAIFIEQIKQTGHPLVLTLNGKAELVVQDAASYQRLLNVLDQVEAIEGIRKGLKAVQEDRTRPVEEVFEEIRQEHEVSG